MIGLVWRKSPAMANSLRLQPLKRGISKMADDFAALRARIEQVRSDLELRLQREASARVVHERVCAERYRQIRKSIVEMADALKGLVSRIDSGEATVRATAWSTNWKAWTLMIGLCAGMLGGMAWMGGQLYALEPLRVTQAQAAEPKPMGDVPAS